MVCLETNASGPSGFECIGQDSASSSPEGRRVDEAFWIQGGEVLRLWFPYPGGRRRKGSKELMGEMVGRTSEKGFEAELSRSGATAVDVFWSGHVMAMSCLSGSVSSGLHPPSGRQRESLGDLLVRILSNLFLGSRKRARDLSERLRSDGDSVELSPSAVMSEP